MGISQSLRIAGAVVSAASFVGIAALIQAGTSHHGAPVAVGHRASPVTVDPRSYHKTTPASAITTPVRVVTATRPLTGWHVGWLTAEAVDAVGRFVPDAVIGWGAAPGCVITSASSAIQAIGQSAPEGTFACPPGVPGPGATPAIISSSVPATLTQVAIRPGEPPFGPPAPLPSLATATTMRAGRLVPDETISWSISAPCRFLDPTVATTGPSGTASNLFVCSPPTAVPVVTAKLLS